MYKGFACRQTALLLFGRRLLRLPRTMGCESLPECPNARTRLQPISDGADKLACLVRRARPTLLLGQRRHRWDACPCLLLLYTSTIDPHPSPWPTQSSTSDATFLAPVRHGREGLSGYPQDPRNILESACDCFLLCPGRPHKSNDLNRFREACSVVNPSTTVTLGVQPELIWEQRGRTSCPSFLCPSRSRHCFKGRWLELSLYCGQCMTWA